MVNQTHLFGAPLQLLSGTWAHRDVNCMVSVGYDSALEIPLASGGRLPRL